MTAQELIERHTLIFQIRPYSRLKLVTNDVGEGNSSLHEIANIHDTRTFVQLRDTQADSLLCLFPLAVSVSQNAQKKTLELYICVCAHVCVSVYCCLNRI